MGLLSNIIKTAVDVATIPLDVAEDIINIGEDKDSKIVKKVEELKKDIL